MPTSPVRINEPISSVEHSARQPRRTLGAGRPRLRQVGDIAGAGSIAERRIRLGSRSWHGGRRNTVAVALGKAVLVEVGATVLVGAAVEVLVAVDVDVVVAVGMLVSVGVLVAVGVAVLVSVGVDVGASITVTTGAETQNCGSDIVGLTKTSRHA